MYDKVSLETKLELACAGDKSGVQSRKEGAVEVVPEVQHASQILALHISNQLLNQLVDLWEHSDER